MSRPLAVFVLFILLACHGGLVGAPDEHGFTEEDRAWWAIQPVADPAVPEAGEAWAKNPIDRFVFRKLAAAGLGPAPAADRGELVRRAYFDLHGLPPEPEEVEAFVASDDPRAWERLVDALLDSPRYGERWAQHWLDVVRYAESDGYRQDAYRPEARFYRDYVIRSFNEDKPYDRFVKEQLAGDEIAPDEPEVFIGTAFLRHGVYEYNQRNVRMHWELAVDEMTNTTGEVFLGLGIGCARCHDHKFDPILQKDYFAFQSFLATTVWPTDVPLARAEELAAYEEKRRAWEAATQAIRNEIQVLVEPIKQDKIRFTLSQFPEDIQAMYAKPRDERTPYEQQLVMFVDRQVDYQLGTLDVESALRNGKESEGEMGAAQRYEALKDRLVALDHLRPRSFPAAFVATDVARVPAKTYLTTRGGRAEVEPAFPTLLGLDKPVVRSGKETTGRRTALAEWIAREDNALSTRVIVNRLWHYHFGRGLVPTPNDFGTLGEAPSHPQLRDWLTTRFRRGGWKMKEIHRLVMTSATYGQTARWEPGNEATRVDPSNRLLWRFPPRRLDAEQVRDGMLAVSGELTHRLGGDSVDGNQPRRSVYVKKIRNTPDPMLHDFDAPEGFDSAPERMATTTPIQSLLLVNGEWTLNRATAFANRVLDGQDAIGDEVIRRAYRWAYGREPTAGEIERALTFILNQRAQVPGAVAAPVRFPGKADHGESEQAFGPGWRGAVTDFCHALLTSNEFLYLH